MKYLFAFLIGSGLFNASASVYAMFLDQWPGALYLVLLSIVSTLAAMLVHVVEWLPVLRGVKS